MQKIKKIIANTPEISVILALALIMTVTAIANSNFLSVGTMTALLKSIPFIALATLGCSLCLNCGVLDISIGRVAGLCGMVFGYILDATGSLIAALACGIGCGLLFGFINAFLSINVGVDSFIVTMGTLYVAGGLRYMINSGDPITLPESYRNFSPSDPLVFLVLSDRAGDLCDRRLYAKEDRIRPPSLCLRQQRRGGETSRRERKSDPVHLFLDLRPVRGYGRCYGNDRYQQFSAGIRYGLGIRCNRGLRDRRCVLSGGRAGPSAWRWVFCGVHH